MWPFPKEKLSILNNQIKLVSSGCTHFMDISEIESILYRWDLGVGFSQSIIINSLFKEVVIDISAKNLDSVMEALSEHLEGYVYPDKLENLIDEDLVCDTVTIWTKI